MASDDLCGAPDLDSIQAAADALIAEGHPRICAAYWRDVLIMDAIGERWDHWTPPPCPVCEARRTWKAAHRDD